MKMRSIILLAAIPIALLFQGCATPPRITSNKLQSLAYGETFSDVEKQMGSNVMDCFLIRQTNVLYECKIIMVFDTQKSYLLLFKDGTLISMLDAVDERKNSKWRGFSNLTQPDFAEVNALIEEFFPPPLLSTFQFTNSSNLELALKQEKEDEDEGIGMAIGLAPFAIAAAPITAPILIYQSGNQTEWFKKLNSLKTGESETNVKQTLGDPKKIFGSQNEEIWAYKNWWGSLGFKNGQLVWIMNDYKPIERRRD